MQILVPDDEVVVELSAKEREEKEESRRRNIEAVVTRKTSLEAMTLWPEKEKLWSKVD